MNNYTLSIEKTNLLDNFRPSNKLTTKKLTIAYFGMVEVKLKSRQIVSWIKKEPSKKKLITG